ncbi:cell division protein ZapA [candidate division KSB1 bacterium]|nr:cell division protein ZapA [candidate division KSB1 bacterium]
MNNEKNILKVNIFGTEYPLRVSANLEYVQRIADYVDLKMREVQAAKPNRPIHQIAILAALNIADELLKQRESAKKKLMTFEEQTKEISEKFSTSIKEILEEEGKNF